jgi:DNA-binding transcriptional LysR family regulator
VELFLAVAESGSMSAAAKRLQVTQPTVSRRLAEVEAALGEPLFLRTVDGVALTAFGERMLAPSRKMADCAGEVLRVAAGAETSPRGVVRITAPPGFAFEFLAPFATFLRQKLPEITLEVLSTTSYLDLTRREADLAIRLDPLDAPAKKKELVCLASVTHGIAAFATPGYAATLPRGFGLADVAWVGWAPPFEHISPNPQLAALIPGFRPAFASDDYLVQLRAAEAGAGAIIYGTWRHAFSLPTTLVKLPINLGKRTSQLHLVCAKSSLQIARVRAVADILRAELRRPSRRGAGPACPWG